MRSSKDYLLYALATLIVGAGLAGLYDDVAVGAGGAKAGVANSQASLASLPPPFPGVNRLVLVLIGADDRKGEPGRSDTLMVMWLNPEKKRAAIMSIPRDLRVQIPGHGFTKVNAAYAYGGPALTVRTVERLIDTHVDGYVKINFEGFVKAVNVLGGVNLVVADVEGKGRGMNYDDNWGNLHIHLKPGWHHLDGYQAMGFCRYRKSNIPGLGDGDFKRAQRQQQFIRAIVEQKLKVQNLPALLKAGHVIMSCVDTDLSWRQAIDLVRLLKEMKSTDIKSVTLPAVDAPAGGVYYCAPVESAYRDMMDDIQSHLEGAGSDSTRVELLDGSGVASTTASAAGLLRTAGFAVVKTGDASSDSYTTTRICYQQQAHDAATAVAMVLGVGILVQEEPGTVVPGEANAPITVILGKDFKDRAPAAPNSDTEEGRNGTGASAEGN